MGWWHFFFRQIKIKFLEIKKINKGTTGKCSNFKAKLFRYLNYCLKYQILNVKVYLMDNLLTIPPPYLNVKVEY